MITHDNLGDLDANRETDEVSVFYHLACSNIVPRCNQLMPLSSLTDGVGNDHYLGGSNAISSNQDDMVQMDSLMLV